MEVREAPWTLPPLFAIPMSTMAPSNRFSGFSALSNKVKEEAVPMAVDGDLEEGELPAEEGEILDQGMPVELERARESAEKDDLSSWRTHLEAELRARKRALEEKIFMQEEGDQGEEARKKSRKEKHGEQEKKKRVLTAERKKKKKDRDRIKRAEKERAMGVRRVRPVYKQIERPPKPLLPCRFFMKGRCTKGDKCTYSHEQAPDTKVYLCKYFLTHCCLKGDDCPFSHETSKFPCKYFVARGSCKDGEACKFSHQPVSEEERQKIIQRLAEEKVKQKLEAASAAASGGGGGGGGGGSDGLAGVDEKKMVERNETRGTETGAPASLDYDPDWKDFSSAPMDEDNFLFRAAKQAALENVDGTFDPSPVEWWKINSSSGSSVAAEDSFLARQAAALRVNDDSVSPAEGNPACSPVHSVTRPSCSTPGGSVMDQLKDSGIGIFF